MLFSLVQLSVAAAAVGHLSHVTYFIRGEYLKTAPRLFLALVSAPSLLTLIFNYAFGYTWLNAARTAGILYASFVGGLCTSMAIYRLFFHPLRNYPGPFWARLTQWYHVFCILKKNDHYLRLDKLHKQYGDYVRVGPNLLSIADPSVVEAAHETKSKWKKGVWYDVGQPLTSMHQMRDQAMHDKRRKGWWEKAFTMKSIRQYDPKIMKYADLLINQLKARAGQPVNSTEWINYFTFDVMGQLSFGRSFGNLENAESHWFVRLIHESGKPLGSFGSMAWLLHLAFNMPAALNPMVKMLVYSEKCVDERKAMEPEEPDVMSHILEAGPYFNDPKVEKMLLSGDARLLIIAGSDTTATTLTFALYYYATMPDIVKKIRDELEEHNVRNDESFNVEALQHLPYLNALINETLRLHPPVPGGVYRDPPAEGATINGYYVPPGVTTTAPIYTIQRSPKAFAQPGDLIPERWTTRPELILDKSAWFPFLLGRYGCIGKQLALVELRAVLSKIAMEFDVKLAPGETGNALLTDSKDIFTTSASPLNVIFTTRQ